MRGRPPIAWRTLHEVDADTGCWLWRGKVNALGHGVYSGRAVRVRLYTEKHGPLAGGHKLRATCGQALCVNPDHMAPLVSRPTADAVVEAPDHYVEFDTNGGCWLWRLHLNKNGYGAMIAQNGQRGGRPERKNMFAHRVFYEAHKGPIPDGQLVLHRCDVRCCVNPDHLRLGDHAANMADRNMKGRARTGENRARPKLTPEQRLEIRAAYVCGDREFGAQALSRKYGVRPRSILWIVGKAS